MPLNPSKLGKKLLLDTEVTLALWLDTGGRVGQDGVEGSNRLCPIFAGFAIFGGEKPASPVPPPLLRARDSCTL